MDRIDTLLGFLADDPDDAFTRFALAQEYAKRGDAAVALDHYQALRRAQPGYVGTYYHLARLLAATGQADEARGVYREGIGVAQQAGDLHARAELQDALAKLEMSWDDD